MATYLGFYRATPGFSSAVNAYKLGLEGAVDVQSGLFKRVRGLIDALPAGCRFVNAYAPIGGAVIGDRPVPGVMVIQTDNPTDLAAINQHYEGFLDFQWAPANVSGSSSEERSAWTSRLESQSAARA